MKALPLFLLCYFVCIGCANPDRDRAALLERELAETPILAPQFDSLLCEMRRLPSSYQVGILLDVASREEGYEPVAKQEALVIEALPLASKKEKKRLLLQLVDYYGRFGVFSPMGDMRKKSLQRIKELEEGYSLSQEERWKVKRVKAQTLKHLSNSEHSLSLYFELLAEHRAANEPALVIEDLISIAPIFTGLGDLEKAMSLQKEAYQLAIDHRLPEQQKSCSRKLVSALYNAGRYAEVIHQFQEADIELFAASEYLAYSTLATCHLQLNRPDSARFYLEKMVQGSADDRDATFHGCIAETYFAENREDSATVAIAKMMDCFREEEKPFADTKVEIPFSFLPIYSSYATLLRRNGKDREAQEAFHLIEPLMEQATVEDAILADQMDGLTRFSSLCRTTRQYEKVSELLARRDSLRDIYNDIIAQRDSKRIADRFKTQELVHTIEAQQTQLSYSNRVLVIVGVATLVLACSIVMLVLLYRQRRRQLLTMQDKDREIERLRADVASASASSPVIPVLSPQEELFRAAEHKVVTERLFLHKELSLEGLARELDTNRSYLSAAVNSHSDGNFNQWLNDYRIRYIQERISTTSDLTRLADEAGFASVNSFYRNFKRCTGMTPNEYLKQNTTEQTD